MNDRAQTVGDRVSDHSQYLSLLSDVVVTKVFLHFLVGQLARCHFTIFAKRCISQGSTGATAKNSRRQPHLSHTKCRGWNIGIATKTQGLDVVDGIVRHRGDFNNIWIKFRNSMVNLFQVFWRFIKVVVTDDPLGIPVTRYLVSDVHF